MTDAELLTQLFVAACFIACFIGGFVTGQQR